MAKLAAVDDYRQVATQMFQIVGGEI